MPSSTSKTASCTSTARTKCSSSSPTAPAWVRTQRRHLSNHDAFSNSNTTIGQGVLQYFNKGETTPGSKFELKGWAVDANDNLTFNGASLLACPSTTDSSWYVWVSAGVDKPAGQEGCLGFNSRTITDTDPVKCTYSLYQS
jgi:hypothetical protein